MNIRFAVSAMEWSGLGLSTMVLVVSFLLQVFWIISALSAHQYHTGNETDRLALLEFKAKIDEDPLGLLSSWNDSAHFCSWHGVTCSRRHRQRVTRLDLPSLELKGQLSPHVGNLSFLRILNLANNSFRLEIPKEIGLLFRMRKINFFNNSFSGKIPANMSGCSSLRYMDMVSNNLIGGISKNIGLLLELKTLALSNNNLGGEIPSSIGNLSSLSSLYLVRNGLRGNIPYNLGQLKSLITLSLACNKLTGTIPLSVYNISTIEYFSVANNKLEGSLPHNMGDTLLNLQSFRFNNNNFSGSLPATISNASNLVFFQVSFNNFIGKVPSFARSSNLQMLLMFFNNLGYADNGDLDFLQNLFNCTKLETLGFGNNNLGGAIPETVSNMTSLVRIAFDENKISGNIPTGIGNLVNLEVLVSHANRLTGSIPTTIGKLKKMNQLWLHNNKLSGTIPSTLQNLTLLSDLDLTNNNLQGNIPPSIGECINLQQLYLDGNNLSGPIPFQVVSLPSLSIALDLSRNQLSGSIPIEVGKLVYLGYLNISENKLFGEIPKALGSCISMEYLYLGGNFLEGSIPKELMALKGIQKIDLSHNKLSGKIPEFFADRAMDYFNLSFNDFEGQVPLRGVFKNVSQFSIIGNARLCGGIPKLKLPTCSNVHQNHKLSPKIKLAIIIACADVGFIICLLLTILACRSKKNRGKTILEPLIRTSFLRVSYGYLSRATDGFSSENLIGAGNFGSVYKGLLNQEDTLVAVKVFNLQVSRALKSFIAECESLSVIKHRNLVKILTVCSGIDFQGNDFRALVYEFMENGSLEEWLHLHSSQSQSRRLNLIQRINIAGDVAGALDYLHNHCPESIAHCDIKPSNILLDGDMVAHVGDFGLAKLLKSAFSNSSNQTSSIGIRGTVGYVAPEYVMGSEVSTSGDIYSFGILLLEMFTGRRPTDSMFKDDFNLHYFASAALPERISEVVDPMLLEVGHVWNDLAQVVLQKSLVSIIEIGVSCSAKFPGERRNIGDVAFELGRIRDNLNAHRFTPRNRVRMA